MGGASESETEHMQCLADNQQREANHRATVSEAQHMQRLADNQQREANRRALKSEAQQEQCQRSNRECTATHRANVTVEERQHRRETECINASRQRSAARKSVHDL